MKRIAYLSNPYPAISHTFIFREIESLRREGIEVFPISVSLSPDLEKMTLPEQEEAQQTLVLKTTSPLRILIMAILLLFSSPAGFFKMTMKSLSFCFKGPKNIVKAVGYLAEAVIVLNHLKKHQIFHIHEHFANPSALVAMLCQEYGGISYSISVHGPDIFYQVDSSLLFDKVDGASFVRCISHYCRSQIMRITEHHKWKDAHIVRCGVNPEKFLPRVDPKNSVPQLVCVGRLCPAKGQNILLEACSLLRKQNIHFKMTFVGDGPDRNGLEKLCLELGLQDFVCFTGALGQNEVQEAYNKADIFVLPSFAEGVPVVLMEAMAMEMPVVSTRITGIPELIEHEKEGLLATPGDMDDLVLQLNRLLADPTLASSLGKCGREKVKKMYNQHQNNKELAELFKKMEP
ncbi:MAG: glycosyltransferase family 4 protein [Desulfotalea sp.]